MAPFPPLALASGVCRFSATKPQSLLQAEPSGGTLVWASHRPSPPPRALGLSPRAGIIWLPPSSAPRPSERKVTSFKNQVILAKGYWVLACCPVNRWPLWWPPGFPDKKQVSVQLAAASAALVLSSWVCRWNSAELVGSTFILTWKPSDNFQSILPTSSRRGPSVLLSRWKVLGGVLSELLPGMSHHFQQRKETGRKGSDLSNYLWALSLLPPF